MMDMLNHLDIKSGIILVQKETSIQAAVDVSMPGDIIFIEPGIYKESITIHKPNIKLFGISCTESDQVVLENPGGIEMGIKVIPDGNEVKICNIQIRGFTKESANISQFEYNTEAKNPLIQSMIREKLGDSVAHYKYEIRLGEGQFEVVRLHRLVREEYPYQPIHTEGNIFMVHGAIQDFDDIYLTAGSEKITKKSSSALYLASRNIDVWGIDLAWTFVSAETADFRFMKGWGIERDIDNTLSAMSVARLIRGFTCHDFGLMNLLGFSYSVMVAYGAAGRESQKHPVFHNIKGLVSVDQSIKCAPSDEEFRVNASKSASKAKEFLDKGHDENNWGAIIIDLSNRALTAPEDISPIPGFDGMTNSQVLHFMGSMKYKNGNAPAPFWHFVGGDLNDLYYTDIERWLKLTASLVPFQPALQLYEYHACLSDEIDLGFDDHLADITIPIFYLGAAGGTGTLGEYSCSLTASNDITCYTVSIPDVERKINYGHADLFLGKDAHKLVWDVLYNWLMDHSTV